MMGEGVRGVGDDVIVINFDYGVVLVWLQTKAPFGNIFVVFLVLC